MYMKLTTEKYKVMGSQRGQNRHAVAMTIATPVRRWPSKHSTGANPVGPFFTNKEKV
jgi:hypothetical protein